jgi:outer membrane lipoprotein-sorting protein
MLSSRGLLMKRVFHSVLYILVALITASAAAQAPMETILSTAGAPLSAQDVVNSLVQKNSERSRALAAYEGTRVYRLEYHGFPGSRSAEMIVDVKYRSPETKEFTVRSQTGSKLILNKVFKRMLESEQEAVRKENQSRIALTPENYRFKMDGSEDLPSGPAYILSVEPLTDNKLLYRGKVWVDAADFAVVRIKAQPSKNPSFWTKESTIEQVYSKVGLFWLPLSNRSTSSIRLGGKADLSIDYKDYKITTTAPENKPPIEVTD